jgi:diguanylate cyclase (GGDEF)-like protein/PAS domain S-box-containing protein
LVRTLSLTDGSKNHGPISQLFDGAKQAAFAYAVDSFEILAANDAAVRHFGFPRSELIGASLVDFAPRGKAGLNRRRLIAASSDEMRPFRMNIRNAGNAIVPLRGVTIPIELDGKAAGLVILGGRPSLGGSFTGVAARALKQANYENEIRRHEALTQFNGVALDGLDHAGLLRAASRLLRDSLEVDFCLAFAVRERDGVLTCVAADGWTGDIDELRFDPAGTTIAARAFQSRDPVTVSYQDADARSEESALLVEHFAITSAIGIPIRDKDRTIGSICAYSRTAREYDASEIRYMQTVARSIAMAADRGRAIREGIRSAERVSEILSSIVEHFVYIDRDWRIIFVNASLPALFGRSAGEMLGQPVADFLPTFKDPKFLPIYKTAMSGGESAMFEFTSSMDDRNYEARVRPTPEGIGVYFLDITRRRRAEEARRGQEHRTRQLLHTLPVITWMTDNDLVLVASTGGGLAKVGLQPDELVGKNLATVFSDPAGTTMRAHERALAGESIDYIDDFGGRTFQTHLEPVADRSGSVAGVAGLSVDITDKLRVEQQLADAQSVAHFGIWYFENAACDFVLSGELLRIFGRTRAEMPRSLVDITDLVTAEDRETTASVIRSAVARDAPWIVDHGIIAKDGTVRYVQNTGRCFLDANGNAVRGFGSLLDITDRKLAERELTRIANVDALTALPNRRQITSRIGSFIGETSAPDGCLAVCCLDLDRFNSINQSLGDSLGDDVLVAVGERLLMTVRPGDLVGRLGSDEFVAVFARVRSRSDSGIIAANLRNAFAAPIVVGGKDLFVTVSGGMSFYPSDGATPEELLRHADAALIEAKQAGGDRVIVYAEGMQASNSARLDLFNELHRAVERDEFCIHLQPIVDVARKKLAGFEALVRWAHPTKGLVPPSDFIPVAEQTGLIVPIGRWVLRTATALAARWRSIDGTSPSISVNVSARQFADESLVSLVSEALHDTGLPAARLCLEVTESAIVRDMQAGAATLRALREMGVTIAIDDFGTGYSSMNYLRSFAFDTLKIDRSFIHRLTESVPDASIARGIIALGHAMSMKVVAEGVETEEEANFLRAEGCDELQGFLISRPVPQEKVAGLIERFKSPANHA